MSLGQGLRGITPQGYAKHLNCASKDFEDAFSAARLNESQTNYAIILKYIAFLGYDKDSGKVSLLIEPVLMAEDRWSPLTMT